jgi:exodeoxyribonuclease V alpha subunit
MTTNTLIKYNSKYYLITDIKVRNNEILYTLGYINDKNNTDSKLEIYSTDANIISIDKEIQDRTISYLKFTDRYNSTISYLKKKNNELDLEFLDYSTLDRYMNNLFVRCKLQMRQLNKIEHTLKKTRDYMLELKNIWENPFDFISEDFQLISYKKAEDICNEYDLKEVIFETKLEKWSYDLFLRGKNAFYIPKWMYIQEMQNFCIERQKKPAKWLDYIDKIIIDKLIDGKWYKTTNKFLSFEAELIHLTIELFYDKEYDISSDKIVSIIQKYEVKTRVETNKPLFSLEIEQIKSVVNSIRSKLSIITGPPGTGKTEILKCINFVLHELYEEDRKTETECDDNNPYEVSNVYINPKTIGLIAPTGLAFINMQRSQIAQHYNNELSGTCHRTFYNTIPNIKKHKTECNCEEGDKCKYKLHINLFELDEISMVDARIFHEILTACKYFNSRLILLGDAEQLPSIGPGQILHKLIKSNMFTVTSLTKIKRQNAGALVNNILKMSKDIIVPSDFTDDSMVLLDIESFIGVNNKINKEMIINLIKNNNFNKHNTKFIVGFNTAKFKFNTTILNNILQDIFNPLNDNCEHDIIYLNNRYDNSYAFRVQDKIIRTENEYCKENGKMRANGEEADILEFDGTDVTIKYYGSSDKPEKIRVNELYENFALNYCVTVHKSQGSQYVNVVYFLEPNQTITDKKSMYTAISRAKERCVIISNKTDFVKVQSNKKMDFKTSLFMEELFMKEIGYEVL